MKKLLFIWVLLTAQWVRAGNVDWPVSKIPAALLKNANAVLRLEELEFEMENTHHTVFRNHYVITVLDESGAHWAEFSETYDQFESVISIDGRLFDAAGKEIRKLKNKDITDVSAVDDNDFMDDMRLKLHNFNYGIYPYTIEYDVRVRFNTTIYFPDWVPQGGEKLSVENSSVTYIFPENYQLRYQAFNYQGEPFAAIEKGKKILKWSANNMIAFLKEPFQPPLHEITTYVAFAPSEFEMGDYKGNMSSWQALGGFQFSLNQGRDVLPDNIKQKIHALTDGLTDPKKKIRVLYEFLQKNTRYISIQLGIGGLQPFDASFVAAKGYGDCKALSNYMYSMLKEAGIESNYTLIRAGRDIGKITETFPSDQFNHVILAVPLQQDTVWLECTSPNLPAGYLSEFTSDRYALLIDKRGGKLVRTPKYGIKENLQTRKINAVLGEDATLQVKVGTVYTGMKQDLYNGLINGLSKDRLKQFLHNELDLGTYEINDFNYQETKSSLPSIQEQLTITATNYATITGKRLFIVPNIMTRSSMRLLPDNERKYDIDLRGEYLDIDSVEIQLPPGYVAESVPQDVRIDSRFGKYDCAVKLDGDRIIYRRKMEQYSGRFPAKDYPELVKFYENIYKADRARIVFVKK